jgi:hypothetical protein
MSVTYKACTIIGIKISSSILRVTAKRRGCSHKEAESKHCSECGKLMWISYNKEIPAYAAYQGNDKFAGLDATTTGSESNDDLYVGEIYEQGDDETPSFKQVPDIEKIKNKVKTALESSNLWDEKKFGIYTVLYCSY